MNLLSILRAMLQVLLLSSSINFMLGRMTRSSQLQNSLKILGHICLMMSISSSTFLMRKLLINTQGSNRPPWSSRIWIICSL